MSEGRRSEVSDSEMKEVPYVACMWHAESDMADEPAFVRLRLGPQGRVVVPAHFRRALGLEVGDPLVASIEDGRIVLAPRAASRSRLLARFPTSPGAPSVVDELLEQRRADARREAAEAGAADEEA